MEGKLTMNQKTLDPTSQNDRVSLWEIGFSQLNAGWMSQNAGFGSKPWLARYHFAGFLPYLSGWTKASY